MANVTQRLPMLLGGVSQQLDSQKFSNQVRESINAFPDSTFGLIKRSGGQFISELKNAGGTRYSPGAFDGGKWFTIFRSTSEKYLGVIKGANIYIWDIQTGAPQTVNMIGSAANYLTGTEAADYDILTVQDYSYITNKKITVTAQAAGSWANTKAWVALRALMYNTAYTITINSTPVTYNSPVDATNGQLTIATILNSLVASLNGLGVTATAIGSGIYISHSAPFSISVIGGTTNEALTVFQQSVPNISILPNQCKHDYVVKVANSALTENDNYYVKFVADNGVSGPGVWQETRSPAVSAGLTNSTMPHQLLSLGNGVFEFKEVSWEPRLVGDDETNPMPTFVGNSISKMFFYKNRFGVLTSDNVVMTQAGDYLNWYVMSALTPSDADPIDVTTSSTTPTNLSSVIAVNQGLILFSNGEQYLLPSTAEGLTPSNVANIRTLSRYEYDNKNDVLDTGDTIVFITKSNAYTRVFEMEPMGQDYSPLVSDTSLVVPEWIPSTINTMSVSSRNNLVNLSYTGSRDIYQFQFFKEGGKRTNQAWYKWRMSGNVQHHAVENDNFWVVTKQSGSYVIQKLAIVQSPDQSTLRTTDGSRIDPKLDLWKANATTEYVGEDTKVRIPWVHDSSNQLCIVIANSTTSGPDYSNSGRVYIPETVNSDGTGWYALLENVDLTGENLVVGYTYDMQVEFPTLYFKQANTQDTAGTSVIASDTSAYVSVNRMKFSMGLTGDTDFVINARGKEPWTYTGSVKFSNYYKLNDIPFVSSAVFTVPINERNDNFSITMKSTSPFPVSLVSCTWEGRFFNRSYRRV